MSSRQVFNASCVMISKVLLCLVACTCSVWIVCQLVTHACAQYKPQEISEVRNRLADLIEENKRNGNFSRILKEKRCWLVTSVYRGRIELPLGEFIKYSALSYATLSNFSNGIPKILHTTWKTEIVDKKWKSHDDWCRLTNAGFLFCHWTDEELVNFVASEYPDMLAKFLLYPYPIQRADVGRYLLLHRFGGFYRDTNLGCAVPLNLLYTNESLRHEKRNTFFASSKIKFQVLLTQGNPIGVAGDFLASVPRHVFFELAIEKLKDRPFRYGLPYVDVMLGTGPLFLSSVYSSIIKNSSIPNKVKDEIRVIPLDSSYNRYFYFLSGGTWHCADGVILWWSFEHKFAIVVAISGILVLFKLRYYLCSKYVRLFNREMIFRTTYFTL